jgi:cytochrome c biogenesis protein CcmG, thiol:disulfide interchange protein DsbE
MTDAEDRDRSSQPAEPEEPAERTPPAGPAEAAAVAVLDDPGDDPGDQEAAVPRRSRTAVLVSLVVAVVVVAFVAVLATREPATDREAESDLIGDVAPALAGETLDGGSFDIGDHRGRWVVVNFFATWCIPCRQEHPELVAFDEDHRVLDDAVLVSVLFEDDPDTAGDYFSDNGGDWPVILDGEGLIATSYGVPKVPETYLVAPDGRVVRKLIGGVTQAGLEQAMAEVEAG